MCVCVYVCMYVCMCVCGRGSGLSRVCRTRIYLAFRISNWCASRNVKHVVPSTDTPHTGEPRLIIKRIVSLLDFGSNASNLSIFVRLVR